MNNYTVSNLQSELDSLLKKHYPYLKIVLIAGKNPLSSQAKLNLWRRKNPVLTLDNLHLEPHLTVESFVNFIQEEFGLEVMVLRIMRNSLLPVKHTIHMSFDQQNKIGLELALSQNILIQ